MSHNKLMTARTLVVVVLALFVGAGGMYLYLMSKPQSTENITAQDANCAQLATQYVQTENANKNGPNVTALQVASRINDYKVHFNSQLNACLIDYYAIDSTSGSVYAKVVNLDTHETILTWAATDTNQADESIFKTKENQLMSE